jgi:hypothetical protein
MNAVSVRKFQPNRKIFSVSAQDFTNFCIKSHFQNKNAIHPQMEYAALRSFVDIKITDRQNVDNQIVYTKMYILLINQPYRNC